MPTDRTTPEALACLNCGLMTLYRDVGCTACHMPWSALIEYEPDPWGWGDD